MYMETHLFLKAKGVPEYWPRWQQSATRRKLYGLHTTSIAVKGSSHFIFLDTLLRLYHTHHG